MSDTTVAGLLIFGLIIGIIGGLVVSAATFQPQTTIHTEAIACLPPKLFGSDLQNLPLGQIYYASNGSYIAFPIGGRTPIKLSNHQITLPLRYDQSYFIHVSFNLYKMTGTVCDELNPVHQISSAYLVNSTGGIVR